jgi:type II secretory pathway pseudopilin PulG
MAASRPERSEDVLMSTGRTTPPSRRRREAGFSVIETLCGMTVMFVGLLSLASSTVTGMATSETNRESARATSAARQFLETMQLDVAFEDVYLAYTPERAIPVEELETQGEGLLGGLLGQATELLETTTTSLFRSTTGELKPILSREFEVAGLEPRKGALRGTMGSVCFPVAQGEEGLELREDVAGRDLNGDGVIDNLCHAHDYKILPVTVKVEWKGTRGDRQLEFQTLLVRR